MKNKHAVLLSTGSPIALKVLYCLRKAGLFVHLLDLRKTSSARHSRYITSYTRSAIASTADITGEEIAESIRGLVAKQRLPLGSVVVPSDVESVGLLFEARERLQDMIVFPVSSASTVRQLDDKLLFQQLLGEHNIPGPAGMIVDSVVAIEDLDRHGYSYPLVIKTRSGESGHGVFFAQTKDQARQLVKQLLARDNEPLLVQEYVHGIDADLSVLCVDGKVRASVLQLRHGEDEIEFSVSNAAIELGRQLVAATSFTGVANIDLRIQSETGNAYAIECNPRFWYTLQASLWRGFNFVEAGLLLANDSEHKFDEANITNGRYHLHGRLLKRKIWNPRAWGSIDRSNLGGLVQALSDPAPFMRDR